MPQFSDDLFLGPVQTFMGVAKAPSNSVFTGSVTLTVLTVTAMKTGDQLAVGQFVTGSGITAGSYITSFGTGAGGAGTYNLSASSSATGSISITAAGNAYLGDPAPMELGVGPLGRVYFWDCVPQTKQAANIAASQTPAGAGNLTLTAGTSANLVTNAAGVQVIQLDCPRAVQVTQVSAGVSANFTVKGFDIYGQPMSELIASTSGSTVNGKKAFSQILSIAVSGGTTTAVTVGTTDILGCPVRVSDLGYIQDVGWANTLARDAGTAVAADMTNPATTTTGDVRGTYLPSSASNGSNRLVYAVALPAIAVGPNATRVGALGVTQV